MAARPPPQPPCTLLTATASGVRSSSKEKPLPTTDWELLPSQRPVVAAYHVIFTQDYRFPISKVQRLSAISASLSASRFFSANSDSTWHLRMARDLAACLAARERRVDLCSRLSAWFPALALRMDLASEVLFPACFNHSRTAQAWNSSLVIIVTLGTDADIHTLPSTLDQFID